MLSVASAGLRRLVLLRLVEVIYLVPRTTLLGLRMDLIIGDADHMERPHRRGLHRNVEW